MRYIIAVTLSMLSFAMAKGQLSADLKRINKTQNGAIEDQKEIERLQTILIKQFLAQANNASNELNKKINDFFSDYTMNNEDAALYNYPKDLQKANLSISIINFDYSWGLLPKAGNDSMLEGHNDRSINAIVTIPIYDSYRRGYSINSISFVCDMSEVVTWTEKRNNNLPIEKLPGYKKQIDFKAKFIDFDK